MKHFRGFLSFLLSVIMIFGSLSAAQITGTGLNDMFPTAQAANETEGANESIIGRHFYFGAYPQHKVTDPNLIAALSECSPDDSNNIELGRCKYKKYKNNYYVFEPIEWRIYLKEDNLVSVISEKILDYRGMDGSNTLWPDTAMRSWLNSSFVNEAFSATDKQFIKTVSVKTNGQTTNDLCVLPTAWHLTQTNFGFKADTGADASRAAVDTEFAAAHDIPEWNPTQQRCRNWYWTRERSSNMWEDRRRHIYVKSDGSIEYNNGFIYMSSGANLGVRPMCCVDLFGAIADGEKCDWRQKEENGIKITVNASDNRFYIKNHLLYNSFGAQLPSADFNVTLTNISSDQLATEECTFYYNVTYGELTEPEVITLNKGESRTFMLRLSDCKTLEKHVCNKIEVSITIQDDHQNSLFDDSFCYDLVIDPDEIVIPGFNASEDTFSLPNSTQPIDEYFYQTLYKRAKASESYHKFENGENHGRCFGMSAAVKDFRLNRSRLTSFSGVGKIADLEELSYNTTINKSLHNYLKYLHIFQYSPRVSSNRMNCVGYDKVFQYVSNNLSSNKAVLIDLFNRKNQDPKEEGKDGHNVLAVGTVNRDILIYDPNCPGTIQRIKSFADGSWFYHGAANWDSDEQGVISYVKDFNKDIYNMLVRAEQQSIESRNLISTNQDGPWSDTINNNVIIIDDTNNNTSNVEKMNRLYWADEGADSIAFTAQGCSFYKLISDYSSVQVTANDGNHIVLTSGNDIDDSAEVRANTGEKIELIFSAYNGNGDNYIVNVSGSVFDSLVEATVTESGLKVDGLNNISVTLSTEGSDTLASTSAKIEDGRTVNITVDEPNGLVSTDYDDKHPENDNNSLCKFCGKDHTGSFWQRIVGFFHRIFYFFAHLFGKM